MRLLLGASRVWVSIEARIADTLVGNGIRAVSTGTAARNTNWRKDGWNTHNFGVSEKVRQADAAPSLLIAACTDSTPHILTFVYAEAVRTFLPLRTRPRVGAPQVWSTLSSLPGVSSKSFEALADAFIVRVDDAVCVDAAPDLGTRRTAPRFEIIRVTLVPGSTGTGWFVVLRRAVGVWPTLGCDARIETGSTLCFAHGIPRTLLVHPAAHRTLASCGEGIPGRRRRAFALKASDDVDANCAHAARSVGVDGQVGRALVDIPTACLRISRAPRIALALRTRRGDGTRGILATLDPGARVFARLSFEDVRRLALALSLSTLFVGGAV